jgi:hypothetical protein
VLLQLSLSVAAELAHQIETVREPTETTVFLIQLPPQAAAAAVPITARPLVTREVVAAAQLLAQPAQAVQQIKVSKVETVAPVGLEVSKQPVVAAVLAQLGKTGFLTLQALAALVFHLP